MFDEDAGAVFVLQLYFYYITLGGLHEVAHDLSLSGGVANVEKGPRL